MSVLTGLLDAIILEPREEDRWQVLADYLEERNDSRGAELLRLHRRLLATCCEPDHHPEQAAWQARVVELLRQGVKPCVPQRRFVLRGGVEMVFNLIPPGHFLMGSPASEENRESYVGADETQHPVSPTSGVAIATAPPSPMQ